MKTDIINRFFQTDYGSDTQKQNQLSNSEISGSHTMLLSAIPNCNSSFISTAPNQKKGKQEAEAQLVVKPHQELKFVQRLAPPLFAAFLALSPIIAPPVSYGQAIDVQRGASLFNRACIGCHDAGGNILQPGATLFLKDLQRNGIDTEEEIYRITYYGKGRMPGFGEMCTPRGQCTFGARLQEDEIRLLADFVKSQADQGWPNIVNNGD
ncbi:putative cytochrome c-like domain-containing protein [Helianthus annuus]|uniref:Cytochrome c-553 n=1 Tax=Helianthus annuus TaxID=4232 RepID=A0A251SM61_HELAN|nr:cytochrome c6, chloroplastic [Helianthus annuus]KAF5769558.1 putative cytochrome c-like domain-containing protein [Helianthus annuus]KAJ0486141.1 putative cytochrome c-like domain-containing protein [Helianthus annuus]